MMRPIQWLVALLAATFLCFPAQAQSINDDRYPQLRQAPPAAAHERVATVPRAGRAPAIGHRPAGCPRRWCGCFLAKYKGIKDKTLARKLWLARNWAHVGRPAGGPKVGAVVVWRGHVGLITDVDGRRIRVLSGNDGNAVRNRWRSTAGVIAYRMI